MRTNTLPLIALGLLVSLGASAQPGYVTDASGVVVRNGAGGCWHTPAWLPWMAVPGCDGAIAVEPAVVVTPEPPPVAVVEVTEVVPLPPFDPVLFVFDSAVLTPRATERLDDLVQTLNRRGERGRVRLSGHADRIGPENYNQMLSERRAESVREYLRPRLDPDIGIEVVGRGESMPTMDCPDLRGNALIRCLAPDRRVVVEAVVGE